VQWYRISHWAHIRVTWSVHVFCIQISDYFSGIAKCICNFTTALMQSRLQVNISEFSWMCYLEFTYWQHGKCKIIKLFWSFTLIKKYEYIVIFVDLSYNVCNFCSQCNNYVKGLTSVN